MLVLYCRKFSMTVLFSDILLEECILDNISRTGKQAKHGWYVGYLLFYVCHLNITKIK